MNSWTDLEGFGGADPLVRGRRPRRPFFEMARIGFDEQEKPARGPAADQGVRPTKGSSYLSSYFADTTLGTGQPPGSQRMVRA